MRVLFGVGGVVLVLGSNGVAAPSASSICTGQTVAGVAGTAVCISGSVTTAATASDILAGYGCWNVAGGLVYGTMPNNSNWDVATAFPGAGYYTGVTNLPQAGELCGGTSLFGVTGGAQCGFANQFTHTGHRDRGTTPAPLSATPGTNYRSVPLIAKDDDGYAGTNAPIKLDRFTSTWSGSASGTRKVCGKDATSITTKISDCASLNTSAATWNGATNGTGGEGTWTLVTVYSASLANAATCDTTCYEVWRDDRTGLLWSDTLADTVGGSTYYNWCRASGSNFSDDTSNPYREDDPNNVCDSVSNQNQTQPESLCFEDSAWLSTPSTTAPMKGGMHRGFGGTAPATQVKWRLPTLQDYRAANINGIRFVLPNFASFFWSASVYSSSRDAAWHFSGNNGYVNGNYRNGSLSLSGVRCVGGP